MHKWLPRSVIVILAIFSFSWVYYTVTVVTPTITLPLMDPHVVGIWSAEEAGVWTTGDTRLSFDMFRYLPWRKVTWKWRQQQGNALHVTIKTPTKTLCITNTMPQWRTVHLLLDRSDSVVTIESTTMRVAGDRRDLGPFINAPTIYAMHAKWWEQLLWMIDIWLPLFMAGGVLWRSRWWGVGAYSCFVLVYAALIWTDHHARPITLFVLDENIRHVLTIGLALWWIRQWVGRFVSPAVMTTSGRRFGLDVMRAIAILFVVYSHATFISEEWTGVLRTIFHKTIYLGSVGVDLFFALSGYLIGRILLRLVPYIHDYAILQRFWVRRWLRTLPAAYVSAVVVWFVAAPRILNDYLASIMFVGSFNPLHIAKDNQHWWSLSTEELFYLLVPFLLFLGVRRWQPRLVLLSVISGIVVFTAVARVVFVNYLPANLIGWVHVTSYVRLDSIVWGMVIRWVQMRYPERFAQLAGAGFAPGIILMLSGSLLLIDQTGWVVTAVLVAHILTSVGAALLIPAFEYVSTSGWRLLDRVVVWISVISYSLYLYNLMIADAMTRRFGTATSWTQLSIMVIGYVVVTFVGATLSYRLVEKPVLRWRDRYYPELPTQMQESH